MAYDGKRNPASQIERRGFAFGWITISNSNISFSSCIGRISGIHALYILIEKRFSQFKESQNFRIVNNAKPLLDNITIACYAETF